MAKLSHKDKLAIVRDAIISNPRYNSYGFNRNLRDYIKKEFGVKLFDSSISKLKKQTLEQIENDKTIIISKKRIIEMHSQIFQKAKAPVDKTRSLIEIGKLEGHYEDKIKIIDDESNGELKALAEKIKERIIKENNGKHNKRGKTSIKK